MTATGRSRLPAGWLALAALPIVLLGLAYLSSVAIDVVLRIGPFDRAKLGFMFTVPLMLLAPGTGALALRAGQDRRSLGWLAIGVSALFAAAVATWRLSVTTSQIECDPVTDWTQALPRAVFVGIVGAIALLVATGLTAAAGRGTVATLVIGAAAGFVGGLLVLFAMSVAFPAVLCAPRL
jgi:hypothetical protein